MTIQINASQRLVQAHQVLAATAADAGKIALWINKATGAEGKKKGRAGKEEGLEFKIKAGKDTLTLSITLDQAAGGVLKLEGDSKSMGHFGHVSEKTGRQTIIAFKEQLRAIVAAVENKELAPETYALLKKLLAAKSKVEA